MIRQDWSSLKKLLFFQMAAGGGAAVEATATGNPLTFQTDLARQLKSLLIPFTPQQSGTGDPSPQNIRSILPWDGLKVWNGGKNLAKLTYGTKVPSIVTGQMVTSNGWSSDFIRIDKTKNYYCSGTDSLGNVYALYYGADHSYLGNRSHNSAGFSLNSDSYFSSATYVKLRNDSNSSAVLNIQLEEGSSATPYEAPNITDTDIVFPSPVYGGSHEAVSGKLQARQYDSTTFRWGDATNITVIGNVERRGFIVPRQVKTPEELHADPTSRFCSCATWSFDYAGDYIHYYGGGYSFYIFLPVGTDENLEFQLVVERPLPPQEQTLTGHQLTALVGDNNIWSDSDGSMTATYLKKG